MQTKFSKLDSYLLHLLKLDAERVDGPPSSSDWPEHSYDQRSFPVLVRVRDTDTGIGAGTDTDIGQRQSSMRIQARLGNIISGRATADAIRAFEFDDNVLSVEASRQAGIAECVDSVPFVRGDLIHAHASFPEKGDAAIVAVIDSGIDILHEAFFDAQGNSRILEIWDQRDPVKGLGPDQHYSQLALDYGRIYTSAEINGYVYAGSVPPRLANLPGLVPDRRRHGTHVTSIAAGRAVTPWTPGAVGFAGGMAPEAKIIFVIPKMRTDRSDAASVGYSSGHLEALKYIEAAAAKIGLPVVVNVSWGMNAGAHDGTSLLEAGFDAFTEGGRKQGAVIVKSAGNERGYHGHAKLTLGARSRDALAWLSADIPRPEDHIELWFQACNEFRFWLTNPGGETQPVQVTWDTPDESGTFPASGNTYSMTYTRYHRDNGDSQLRLDINPGPSGQIEPGVWTLHVETGQVRTLAEVHAWIERDWHRAAFFIDHLDEEMTLSIPGTALTTITVGAVNSSFPVVNNLHSSYGRTRDLREKPDLVAPGAEIVAADAGTTRGTRAMTGTSMAAPHVAGAVALLLSHARKSGRTMPNAAQIRKALTQNTQTFTSHHTTSSGFGVLDAAALFEALG